MYFTFAVATDFNNDMDYDEKFGTYIGNNFASAMEECFYRNPIHENEEIYYGVSLDSIMSLPQFLTAVLSTYVTAKGKHPKADISNHFKGMLYADKHYPVNDIREETIDSKRCFVYRNIDSSVEQAILFGAYFLASIKAEIWEDEISVRDFLLQCLKEESVLTDEAFEQHHVAPRLFNEYFVPTMRKIAASMNDTPCTHTNTPKHSKDYKAEDIEWQLEVAKSLKPDDPKYLERVRSARETYFEKRDTKTIEVMKGEDKEFLNDFFPMLICCPRQYLNSITGNICHEPHRTVNRQIDKILLTIGDFNEQQRILTFNVAYGCCIYLVHLMKPEVKLQHSLIDQVCWNVRYYFNHDTDIVREYNNVAYRTNGGAYNPINEILAIFGTIYWLLDVQAHKSEKIKLCLSWLELQFCRKFRDWTEGKWVLSEDEKNTIMSSDNIFHKLVEDPKPTKYELTFEPWSGGRTYEDLKKYSLWRITDFLEEDATLLLLQTCEQKSQKQLIKDLEDILRREFCKFRKRGLNEESGIYIEKRLWKSYGDDNIPEEEFNGCGEDEIDSIAQQHLHFPDWWYDMAGTLKPVAHGLVEETNEATSIVVEEEWSETARIVFLDNVMLDKKEYKTNLTTIKALCVNYLANDPKGTSTDCRWLALLLFAKHWGFIKYKQQKNGKEVFEISKFVVLLEEWGYKVTAANITPYSFLLMSDTIDYQKTKLKNIGFPPKCNKNICNKTGVQNIQRFLDILFKNCTREDLFKLL